MRSRKVWFFLAVLLLLFILLLALVMARPAIPAAETARVDPQILTEMAASPDGTAGAFALFREQADLAPAYAIRDRGERGRFVVDALQATAGRSQARVRAWLDAQGIAYRVFISDNSLFLTANLTVLNRLAAFPEVAALRANQVHSLEKVPIAAATRPAAAIPWNIAKIGADQVWQDFGIKGQGIVVATIDTGAEYTHDALFPNYRCGAGPHDNCWYDPTGTYPSAPGDGMGHGTFLMGLLVGDDDPTLSYNAGVAPDAQWIACKGCTDGGACTDADLIACAQWMLAPNGDPTLAPNVIVLALNSSLKCDGWFLPQIMVWQAAGIYPVVRPGSTGPACDTVRSPGSYEGILAAGATDQTDTITTFSSRGPGCGGGIKPEVVAPGVDICSTLPGNSWTCGYSGTSWSTAQAAGLAALLYSAAPGMIGNAISTTHAITSTALCIEDLSCGGTPCPDGANNVYGWGRIDAYAAVAAILQPCDPVTDAGFTWQPVTPTVGQQVIFTGTATGTLPITYTWNWGDGDFSSAPCPLPPATCSVTHTYSTPGVYTVVMTATNCETATAVVSQSVTVLPCEPAALADFSWTPLTPTVDEVVVFTGTATGTLPITYTWNWGDGTLSLAPCPLPLATCFFTHTYNVPQFYTVILTATNCQGQGVATATHGITVIPPPCEPVRDAAFAWQPITPTVGQQATFTGTATGTLPITYTWDWDDGSFSSAPCPLSLATCSVTHTYDTSGTYTVVLTATNCGTAMITASHTLMVLPPPCDPGEDVGFSWNPFVPVAGQEVTFAGYSDGDPPVTYTWKLDVGTWKEGQVVTHTYSIPGSYTVALTITNCGTFAHHLTQTVEVLAPLCDPILAAGFSFQPPTPTAGLPVTFTAWSDGGGWFTATADSNMVGPFTALALNVAGRPHISYADAAGRLRYARLAGPPTPPISFTWDLGDGGSAAGPIVTHTYTMGGIYTVSLEAANPCSMVRASQLLAVEPGRWLVYLPLVSKE